MAVAEAQEAVDTVTRQEQEGLEESAEIQAEVAVAVAALIMLAAVAQAVTAQTAQLESIQTHLQASNWLRTKATEYQRSQVAHGTVRRLFALL